MTTATLALSAVENLVLARLLAPAKKLGPRDLEQSLDKLLPFQGTHEERNALLRDALQHLEEAGLVTPKPLRLTDQGRVQALRFLGLEHLPTRTKWSTIKSVHLTAVALGLPPGSAEARKYLGDSERLRAQLVRTDQKLATSEFPTTTQAYHALLWRGLGVETDQRFTVKAIAPLLLARVLDVDGKGDPKVLLGLLAGRAAQARNSHANELRHALIRQWLAQPGPRAEPPVEPPVERPVERQTSFNLAGFAEAVQEAARTSPTGRFGDNKVFIAHVWRRLQADGAFPGMDEAAFRQRLVEANHEGLLRLSRADLVEAMDPEDVRASEVPYLNATFHFVQV